MIADAYPDVNLVRLPSNTGFAGGVNAGIQKSLLLGNEYIWLLNNDTVVDSDAVASLINTLSDRSIGAVGSKIYFAKGREFHADRYSDSQKGHVIWYAGGIIDWKNMYASHRVWMK